MQQVICTTLLCLCLTTAGQAADQTIYSWENSSEGWFYYYPPAGAVPFQSTDPVGITNGAYSLEAATGDTSTIIRGPWSSELADLLLGKSVVKFDFHVKDPDPDPLVGVRAYFLIAGRQDDSSGYFQVDQGGPNGVTGQSGTVEFDYAAHATGVNFNTGVNDSFDVNEVRFDIRFQRIGGFTGSVYFDNLRIELPDSGLTGDLNGDGFVGQDDLSIILTYWGQNVTAGDPLQGDPSNDGFVGQDDLNDVLTGWGQGTPPAPLVAVPEPASVVLMAVGSVALTRRRKQG